MANFFPLGSHAQSITVPLINLPNVNDSDCTDIASLSTSLANSCYNSTYQKSGAPNRPGNSSTRSLTQALTTMSFNNSQWGDCSSILNTVMDHSSGLESKPCNNEFTRPNFSVNRYTQRSTDQPKLSYLPHRSNFSHDNTGFTRLQAPCQTKMPSGHVLDGGWSLDQMLPTSSTQNAYTSSGVPTCATFNYSNWLLNPPAPTPVADHLRTGRLHLLKSQCLPDRSSGVSYMDQALRQGLRNKLHSNLITQVANSKFPQTIGPYQMVVPLENATPPRMSDVLELRTQCFKAWSPRLSTPVLLRRVLPLRMEPLATDAYFLARQFCDASDPTIVRLRDVIPVNEFGDNSLLFVYDFVPCCSTLQQLHMNNTAKSNDETSSLDLLPERTAWMFLVQLTQALRFAHQVLNRSIGVLHPNKVLVQDGTKIFVNCFGLKDVINHPSNASSVAQQKTNDFVALGRLMFGVICGTPLAMKKPSQFIPILTHKYSPELPTLLEDLLTGSLSTIDALILTTAHHAYDQLTSVNSAGVLLEQQLLRELENGRLFRLVCKLTSVVERQDIKRQNHHEPEWSETGDRYMLKLFRDFVFHQVDQRGAPHLDLAHIVSVLNKVEAASEERLCLVSRDGQRVVIVTYADIRKWLDASFASLVEDYRRSMFEQQVAQQALYEQQQQQQEEDTGPDRSVRQSSGRAPLVTTPYSSS